MPASAIFVSVMIVAPACIAATPATAGPRRELQILRIVEICRGMDDSLDNGSVFWRDIRTPRLQFFGNNGHARPLNIRWAGDAAAS